MVLERITAGLTVIAAAFAWQQLRSDVRTAKKANPGWPTPRRQLWDKCTRSFVVTCSASARTQWGRSRPSGSATRAPDEAWWGSWANQRNSAVEIAISMPTAIGLLESGVSGVVTLPDPVLQLSDRSITFAR